MSHETYLRTESRERFPTQDEAQQIIAALRGLKFGSVNIIVQDGVVVQIDRTEKRRVRFRRDSTTSHGA